MRTFEGVVGKYHVWSPNGTCLRWYPDPHTVLHGPSREESRVTFKKMPFLSFFHNTRSRWLSEIQWALHPLKNCKNKLGNKLWRERGDSYDSYNFLQQSFFAFSSLSLPQGFLAMNFVRTLGAITTIFFKIKWNAFKIEKLLTRTTN